MKLIGMDFSDFDKAVQFCIRYCEAADARHEIRSKDLEVNAISAVASRNNEAIQQLQRFVSSMQLNNDQPMLTEFPGWSEPLNQ